MKGLLYPGKLSLLSLCVAAAFLPLSGTQAAEPAPLEFEASFLRLSERNSIDLSRFSRGGTALPGTYPVRLLMNGELIQMQDVTFVAGQDGVVRACLTPALLALLPLNTSRLPDNALTGAADRCVDISEYIPEARVHFDSSEQSLNIEAPQVWVNRMARGTVPPSAWDRGVPAALLGYNINAYQSDSYGRSYKSAYAGLNSGLNIGGWYLRHNGSWSWSDDTGGDYQRINTYIQRDIPLIKGRLQAGQPSTSGRLFDTLSFSGAKVESDERMEPQSRRGYAPEIRGIARTSAQVTVRQNGTLLYETTVSPGEFIIDDLYPTGYGGDLDVTVREADGTEQHFQVSYASVSQQLRPGASRYEFVAGELRSDYLRDSPSLWQGTWQYGLNNWLTLYGGVQGSEHYLAGQGGAALGTPLGSFSTDITHARSELPGGDDRNGESYRVSYSKNITETRSNFSLAAYRFSTNGYMDYITAMQTRDAMNEGHNSDYIRRTKSRFTLMVSQGMPSGWGQFYLSTSLQNYWNADGTDKQYQMGYSNRWNTVSWGVSASRSYTAWGDSRDTVMLNLNFPLGRTFQAPTGRLSYTNNSNGRNSWQAGLSGTAGENGQLGYGVSGTTANKGAGSSGSINGSYRTSLSSLSASYGTGRHYNSVSGGLSGTVIGHSGGLTLSPYQGETFALVEAKGAEGARVGSYNGVYVDRNGYAAVPYLSPYQMNSVAVDLQGTKSGVELDTTLQKVAPLDKAVVKLRYNARSGRPLLISASRRGEPLPFGAEIRDEKGSVVGYAGQGGQVYARVEKDEGELRASWGSGPGEGCVMRYRLAAVKSSERSSSLEEFGAECLGSSEGERK
ncbi:TPA: fimbrial biogenesis outer membrane usher protein [Klebsiella oxytoca]|nr:fimbrial biogenesis outer membrane usher protein [Klebsiella oxytoca]